jgi:predicted O-methyltransferase YrrM
MAQNEPWHKWFEGKEFTSHWTDAHLSIWSSILLPLRDKTLAVLEIGSWEGRSAISFLEFLPRSKITCIDNFAGGRSREDPSTKEKIAGAEARFDANMLPYASRVKKINSRSLPALDALCQNNLRFDVIYIDGSHRRDDVLMDSILCWKMLNNNGLLIWDDYRYGVNLPDAERPQQAIDAFLSLHQGVYVLKSSGAQVIVEKTDTSDAREKAANASVIMGPFPRNIRNLLKFLGGKPL